MSFLTMPAQTLHPMMDNPVIWADMPDPDVVRVDDTYYFMSTTMFYMPGAPIMQSKDLVNWELAGYVFDKLTDSPRYDLQEGTAYGRGQWATSLQHHKGRFYALFCANESGDMGRTYLYSAPEAAGPISTTHPCSSMTTGEPMSSTARASRWNSRQTCKAWWKALTARCFSAKPTRQAFSKVPGW